MSLTKFKILARLPNRLICTFENLLRKNMNKFGLKLFKEITAFIPVEKRNAFTDRLTDQEEQRIRELLTGGDSP